MPSARALRITRLVLAAAALLTVAAVLAACGTTAAEKPAAASSSTARGGLEVASATLSTTAPDARLLLVQTVQPATETSGPVWGYLFGSQANDTTYLVYLQDGELIQVQEYGQVGLSPEQWAEVPGDDAWPIDSDQALDAVVKALGATSTPTAYVMGMQTYVPETTQTAAAKALTWYVSFEDQMLSGDASGTIMVDAKTGKVTSE